MPGAAFAKQAYLKYLPRIQSSTSSLPSTLHIPTTRTLGRLLRNPRLTLKEGDCGQMAATRKNRQGTQIRASKKSAFEPKEHAGIQSRLTLPDELWLTVLDAACTFPSEIFTEVMLNLVKNPNVTSSHLFRADIFYDNENDYLLGPEDTSQFVKHMKAEYRPRLSVWPDFNLQRTIVRQLVPRNPQLDKPLIQTCQFFHRHGSSDTEEAEQTLVLYTPHVDRPEDVPFYHPEVSQLAFLHTWQPASLSSDPQQSDASSGYLTLFYRLFPKHALGTKLSRTALRLLQTVHKHGQGQHAGYEKRVHHDQIIPQRRYQDTYTRLKTAYGRKLSEQWVEVTDPGKHVFEDIGIAAFLIELWRELYALPGANASPKEIIDKPPFPGFVDIGCGNGLLVFILLSEGYPGWGFDARSRKTWSIFPSEVQEKLQQRILVPRILQQYANSEGAEDWHNGVFGKGTFIVSNHADELTPWTPLLAYLNSSAFIAIPCCSHDLAGARFRAPLMSRAAKMKTDRLPQQSREDRGGSNANSLSFACQAAETGSLKRTEVQKKMPSAYATLCSYVDSLALEVGYKPEQDVLRIPSTRNSCIVGRSMNEGDLSDNDNNRSQKVIELVERELKTGISTVAVDWIGRAEKLIKKPGSGH